jgi:hypothetical protein
LLLEACGLQLAALHCYFCPAGRALLFSLDEKSKQKNQGCARFARKIGVRTAKSTKLARPSLKQGRFLTPFLLIFRLTGQGQAGRWLRES